MTGVMAVCSMERGTGEKAFPDTQGLRLRKRCCVSSR